MPFNKFVLDTNIWVSFFIKAKFDALVTIILDNDLSVYTSQTLIDELTEVLSRKKFAKYLTLPIQEYVAFHSSLTILIETEALYQSSPDPKDNFLFDLAFKTNCEALVTGDKKLLELDSIDNVAIITLSDFLTMYQTRN